MIIINIFYSKLNFFLSLNNAWPAPKFFYQKKKTGRLNGNGRYHQDEPSCVNAFTHMKQRWVHSPLCECIHSFETDASALASNFPHRTKSKNKGNVIFNIVSY